MASPAYHPQLPGARRPRLLRLIASVLLTLIVLTGLTILIIWLVIKPKRLVYTVEESSIHGFNLANNHLNATFDFVLRTYNPNKRVSIYYDSMVASVVYDDQTIAFDVVDPFFQSHRNARRFPIQPVARSIPLSGNAAKDLRVEKSSGLVELDISMKAKIRFKVGVWKSRHHTLKVTCPAIRAPISSSKNFQRTYCEVDL